MLRIIRIYLRRATGRLDVVANLTTENIALRKQLIVLDQNQSRPKLRDVDRLFWVLLSSIWSGWRNALAIVQPDRPATFRPAAIDCKVTEAPQKFYVSARQRHIRQQRKCCICAARKFDGGGINALAPYNGATYRAARI